jgi:hypothetical protein
MWKPPAWSRRAPFRVVRAITLVLAATWALYLVAVHLVLWTPLLAHELNGSPDSLAVSYESAWSVWPGRVHVNGLRLRIRVAVADTFIAIDHADASFDLPVLLRRQMTVHDVNASGVSVQVRPRMRTGEIGPHTLDGQPEIPGLPDPRMDERPPVLLPDEDYHLFTVDLQHVVADPVREVWIGPYRFAGDMRVEGSMYLRPARKLAIGPARAEVRSGDLFLAKRAFGQVVKGTVTCTVPMTNLRAIGDDELIRSFDVGLDMQSDIEDFGFLDRWVHETGVRIDGGGGKARGRMRVSRGVVQDGSVFLLESKRLEAHHPRAHAVTNLAANLSVEHGEAKGSVVLSHTKVMHRYAQDWPLELETIGIAAHSKSLDLSRGPLDDVVVSADVPAIVVKDLRLLRVFVPKLTVQKGDATIKAHVDFDTHANLLAAEASVSVPHIGVNYGGIGLSGTLLASAKMPKFNLSTKKGTVPSFRVEVQNVLVAAKGGENPPPPWWGRLEARDIEFDDEHVITEVSAKLRDARPIMYLLAAEGQLPEWTRGFLTMEGLTAAAHVETGPGRMEVDRFEAKGGAWKLGGHAKQIGDKREGELYLGNGVLGLKIPLDTGGGSPKPSIGGGPKESQ